MEIKIEATPDNANDFLYHYYAKWLSSNIPNDIKGKRVARSKIAKGILQGRDQRIKHADIFSKLEDEINTSPSKIWIWSDLHLFHKNIIDYTDRPHTSVAAMNADLLNNASCVKNDDWLIFVGDISFGDQKETDEWLLSCPGKKILVVGNHDLDKYAKLRTFNKSIFTAIADCLDFSIKTSISGFEGEQVNRLWLTHYPFYESWVPENVVNIHGHTHNQVFKGRRLNVSVECINFRPQLLVSLLEHGYPEKNWS